MNTMPETEQKFNIGEEAKRYFTTHYPRASNKEIEKQIEDWVDKVAAGRGLVKFFEQRVGNVSGRKVLDVGFGSGGVAIAFNQAGAIAYGVDVDPELKDIAERNIIAHGAQADLHIYDGKKLPYPDSYFDFITSSSVLEHVSFPDLLLNDCLRVLKPSGRMLLSLPNKWYPKETHTLAYFVSYMPHGLANAYLKLLKRSPLEDDNLHFYSYFDVIDILDKTKYKYELVYKDTSNISVPKKLIIVGLKKLGIHYTVFLKQLIFVIEKK